ncbi:MAG: hypothetical protein QM765_26705 [Myxococcales bacterium]
MPPRLEPGASFARASFYASGFVASGPRVTHETLFAVAGTGTKDVWAAGARGTMLRWDGADWKRQEVPVTADLQGLWFAGADDGWAVGTVGTALRWDGTRWSAVAVPVTNALLAVWGTASDSVWAVGTEGVILHWDGKAWSQVERLTWRDFNAVWGRSAKEVWAGGDRGVLARFDGERWKQAVVPGVEGSESGIHGLYPIGANRLGLLRPPVGYYEDQGGPLELTPSADGKSWSVRSAGDSSDALHAAFVGKAVTVKVGLGLTAITRQRTATLPRDWTAWLAAWGAADDDVWAVGYRGALAHFDGKRWQEWGTRFEAEVVGGDGAGLVVLGKTTKDQLVSMRRSSEGSWTRVPMPADACAESRPVGCRVWGTGPGDLWISGRELWRWDGKAWRTQALGKTPTTEGTVQAWAVVGGAVYGWDGKAWQLRSPEGEGSWSAVAGSGKAAWVVGEKGAIARFEQGRWQRLVSPTAKNLTAVAQVGDEAWAVGADVVLRWNGKAWVTAFESKLDFDLRAVCADGRGGVVAVGALGYADGDFWPGGAILEKAGSRWSLIGAALEPSQFTTCATGPDGLWLAGSGTLYWRGARAPVP